MLSLHRLAAWPLVVKVPVLVVGLMITVAFAILQVVLWRSSQDQERNLRLLANAYLDGISAAILQPAVRGDVWEVFEVLDRSQRKYAGVKSRLAIAELRRAKILAASDPLRSRVNSKLPDELRSLFS